MYDLGLKNQERVKKFDIKKIISEYKKILLNNYMYQFIVLISL